jgi:hypothetical protein
MIRRRSRSACIFAWITAVLAAPALAWGAAPGGVTFQGVALSPEGSPLDGPQDIVVRIYDDPASVEAGDLIYQETHLATPFSDGVFSVVIGAGSFPSSPFDASIFANPELWLAVEIAGELLSPRTKFQSAAFALQCSNAETVGGTSGADLIGDVTAGAGLGGGGTGGSISLFVDFTQTQQRVSGACPGGSSIRQIVQDGSVVCEDDTSNPGDVTSVAAGVGLVGGGSQGDLVLSIAAGGVTSSLIANSTITGADIATNTITASQIAAGAVGSEELADASVTSSHVDDESLSEKDLLDEAGADFSSGNDILLALDAVDQVVQSVTISAPTAGHVVVTASGNFDLNLNGLDDARCSITTGTAVEFPTVVVRESSNLDFVPFSATRGFDVSAGGNTFNLVCVENAGIVNVGNTSLTAIFVPARY